MITRNSPVFITTPLRPFHVMHTVSNLKHRASCPAYSHRYSLSIRASSRLSKSITFLGDIAQKLSFQNELALFVLLGALISLVVFPAHCFLALPTRDITHNMFACCHGSLIWLSSDEVHDAVEEVGFAVLAAEILQVS
jgi:hypothetical protein